MILKSAYFVGVMICLGVWENEKILESDEITQKYSNVFVRPQRDKVCILIQPSELREQLNYYYIPENEEQ